MPDTAPRTDVRPTQSGRDLWHSLYCQWDCRGTKDRMHAPEDLLCAPIRGGSPGSTNSCWREAGERTSSRMAKCGEVTPDCSIAMIVLGPEPRWDER